MEIMECEILPDGTRSFRPLFRYHITENRIENGRFVIEGSHERESVISEGLCMRFLENGMPQDVINRIRKGGISA